MKDDTKRMRCPLCGNMITPKNKVMPEAGYNLKTLECPVCGNVKIWKETIGTPVKEATITGAKVTDTTTVKPTKPKKTPAKK